MNIAHQAYQELREIVAPVLTSEIFNMGKSDLHLRAMAAIPRLRPHRPAFTVPAPLMLLQRVNVGTYGNLRALNAHLPVRRIVEEILNDTDPTAGV